MTPRILRSIALAAPLALIACATPTTGTYRFEQIGDLSTNCENTSEESQEIDVLLTVADDGSSLTYGEAGGAITCPLDDTAFTCLEQTEADYNASHRLDAIVTYTFQVVGEWTKSSVITGTVANSTTCAGTQCGDADVEICASEWDFEATLQEDDVR